MRIARILLLLTAVVLPSACGNESDRDKPIVFVMAKSNTGAFWRMVRAGASHAAMVADVYLEWPSVFAANELGGQANVLREAVRFASTQNRRYAMVAAALDGRALADVIHDWQLDYGMRFVAYDEDVVSFDSTHGGMRRYVDFIGTDNLNAGRAAGEYLAKKLNGKGTVALLRLNPSIGTTSMREKGFLAAIANYPGVKVVDPSYYWSMNQDIGSAYELATSLLNYRKIEDKKADWRNLATGIYRALLAQHGVKDARLATTEYQLDGVFTPNEVLTTGMLRALEDHGLAGKIVFVGFDANSYGINALRKGKITALLVQDPYEIGKQAVEHGVELLKMSERVFQEHIRAGDLQPGYVPHALVDRDMIEKCDPLLDALHYGTSAGPREINDQSNSVHNADAHYSASHAEAEGISSAVSICAAKLQRLLGPEAPILHLQSPGRLTAPGGRTRSAPAAE